MHLGIYGNWSFGGDETFTGASSIGAPRKIGEKEYTAGEAEEYTGPPAPKALPGAASFQNTVGLTSLVPLSAEP